MGEANGLLIAGGVSLLLCVVLAYHYVHAKRLLDVMWAVDTYEAKELKRMCDGSLEPTVEIQGVVTCADPLISPAANVPCCHYHTVVKRETRKTRSTYRNGKWEEETYTDWDTIFDRTDTCFFHVEDKTGLTMVNPLGADIDTQKVCDRTTRTAEPWFADGSLLPWGHFRITEEVFAADGYALVLGQASLRGNDVVIRHPDEGYLDPKKKFFVISRKSEKDLARSKQTTATLCFWFAIVAGIIAAACLILALPSMG